MGGWTHARMAARLDVSMDGFVDGWIAVRMYGWID
jgi:hypothetical protein